MQGDGSGLVLDGTGSATWFAKPGSTWLRPSGEFSDLRANGAGFVREYPDSTKVFFNSAGYMTSVADRFGNTTSIGYDGSSRVQTITDPASKVITLGYGAMNFRRYRTPGHA